MYHPEQQDPNPNAGSSTALKIAVGVLIGIVLTLIIGIVGVIGYWRGFRAAEEERPSAPTAIPPSPSPSATTTISPTPSPTPDLAGKYSGPTGSVDISNVTKKGFSFSIGVGNNNGTGSIDGNALWTTPTVAVYSEIPDESLYNDPDSSYYKKKCKLTFRFTGGKLKVSEDEYVCNYWHGAAVDFNGTFAPVKKK